MLIAKRYSGKPNFKSDNYIYIPLSEYEKSQELITSEKYYKNLAFNYTIDDLAISDSH